MIEKRECLYLSGSLFLLSYYLGLLQAADGEKAVGILPVGMG